MSSVHTISADIPEREYYVAPRRGRKRRWPHFLPLLLTAMLLFGSGFLLGRSQAAQAVTSNDNCLPDTSNGSIEAAYSIIPVSPAIPNTENVSGEETMENWALILVNGENPLSEDFSVPELTRLKNGQNIDSRAYPALQEMMDAARTAGYQPLICSSYRTWDKQDELFQKKVQSYLNQGYTQAESENQASFWVARPGTSEHQTGLAVDIVDQDYQMLNEKQENTPTQQWLMAHCAEYGFILRYPTEKSSITGIGYEPWHYRYVGMDAARAITDQGLCLEEYLDLTGTAT